MSKICLASFQLATGLSYFEQISFVKNTSSAFEDARVFLSIRMLSSKPVLTCPPNDDDQSFILNCSG